MNDNVIISCSDGEAFDEANGLINHHLADIALPVTCDLPM